MIEFELCSDAPCYGDKYIQYYSDVCNITLGILPRDLGRRFSLGGGETDLWVRRGAGMVAKCNPNACQRTYKEKNFL